jgi:orotidine-5'-phosphate decarboxylase
MKDRVVTVLDVSSREEALRLANDLADVSGMFKVGSQLFMAEGPAIVRDLVGIGAKVFLDLKFHDIPNTVSRAVLEAAALGVSMMTIHASGGRAMMESVAKALKQFGSAEPLVVAVTVLTSLETAGLKETGVDRSVEDQVRLLALLTQDCGMSGVVCSPQEIQMLRKAVQRDFKLVTPGIRMPDQPIHDQNRVATPREAINSGADYIVVGRAVTADSNPRAAMERLLASL